MVSDLKNSQHEQQYLEHVHDKPSRGSQKHNGETSFVEDFGWVVQQARPISFW